MGVRNQYLFAQAYLDQVMADPSHDEAAATLGQGLVDWAPFRSNDSLSTLIDSWVGPALDILGFHHQGMEGDSRLQNLYSDFTGQQLLALCLVAPPGADIDSTIKGSHYAFQTIAALRQQGCTWGILTDGNRWRLVKADVLRPYETYLEVDLGAMKARPPADTLRVLHAFFRRDAFVADEDNKTLLDEHLARSEDVAESVQGHLRDNMESVLGALCRGFVMADGRQSHTEEQRAEIFDNATYLLYRILFILYAEARGLLPVGNPAYDEIGMGRLVKQAVRYHEEGAPEQTARTLWNGLRRLSKAIYESDEARGVPAYNGGLFSDEDTEDFRKGYLRDYFISDAHLASAFFDLTHMPDSKAPHDYQIIDYRDLSVRALGGLYEGMLEYKLFLAEEKTYGMPDGKGGYEYKLATEVETPKRTYRVIDAGDVYFAQSPTQRKASGSYYTPEYIVDYIVGQTVERGLRELRDPLEAKVTPWLNEVAGALDEGERTRLQKAVDRELLHFIEEAALKFRVCDPAMGSGHFLVNAAHTIANFIVETLNLTPWQNAELDCDPARWRRRLIESCIYGVDLNPLAVELAKLSLWLASVAAGKPLNFLDHHLKVGNSLIGAWVEDLGSLPVTKKRAIPKKGEPQQLSYFDRSLNEVLPTVLQKAREISERPSENMEDIWEKEAAEDAVEDLTTPFKGVANLWTSTYFGNELTQAQYDQALQQCGKSQQLFNMPPVQRAFEIAKRRRFFHWQLEFPEVFHEKSKTRKPSGFDAVVGNPPWVSFGLRGVGKLDMAEDAFYRDAYSNSAQYKLSMYAVFIQAAVSLARRGGRQAFIVPDSFLLGQYFSKLRKHLLQSGSLREIVLILQDFWPTGAVGRSVIYVLEKSASEIRNSANLVTAMMANTLDDFGSGQVVTNSYEQAVFERTHLNRFRLFFDDRVRKIVEKLELQSGSLSTVVKFYSGLIGRSGQQAITIRGKPSDYSELRYGKLLESSGYLGRYSLAFHDCYVAKRKKLYKSGYDPTKYENAKIFLNQTGDSLKATFDDKGYFSLNNMHIGYAVDPTYDLKFITCLLCSRLLNSYYQAVSLEGGRAMAQTDIETIDLLPICRIRFTTPGEERMRLLEQGKNLTESWVTRPPTARDKEAYETFLTSGMGQWQRARLEAQPEQADVVHDLLAHLADRMIATKGERQAAADEFLGWLVTHTSLPLEDWKLKTRVKAYWDHGWGEFERALNANRRAMVRASGRDVRAQSTLQTIQSKFEQSVSRLQPLLQRIASTDRLIDLIVYRLYGLTEEEVAIVESSR